MKLQVVKVLVGKHRGSVTFATDVGKEFTVGCDQDEALKFVDQLDTWQLVSFLAVHDEPKKQASAHK